MANVETTAETNLINAAALKKAREIDFTKQFSQNAVPKLMEALGTTRMIPKNEGDDLYVYEISGQLEDGAVPEGEIIPLSKYTQEKKKIGEVKLHKWRKEVSAEAIMKSGYDVAVNQTDAAALKDAQKGIRTDFFNFLATIDDATTVSGTGLQDVLADTWGELQTLFEDDSIQPVHFVNPKDISDYLKAGTISLQNAFGMKYAEDFLGLGRVIVTPQVEKGKVYSTAQNNLIVYFLKMTGDVARALELTADETGLIGISSGYPNKERACVESLIMDGIDLLVEYAEGVVVGTINP